MQNSHYMKEKFRIAVVPALVMIFLFVVVGPGWTDEKRPESFVDIREVVPSVVLDIRYHGSHNFVGTRVDGYHQPLCLITRQAAGALKKVQDELQPFSLSIKIYDCYRPQRAVDHFVRWAGDIEDTRTKKESLSRPLHLGQIKPQPGEYGGRDDCSGSHAGTEKVRSGRASSGLFPACGGAIRG
jgi:hypothetical protein